MIIYQYPAILNGKPNKKYIRCFSDSHRRLHQIDTGEILDDAVDLYPSIHQYEEHESFIEGYEPEENKTEEIIEVDNNEVQ